MKKKLKKKPVAFRESATNKLTEALKHGSYVGIREAVALEPTADGRKRWKCVLLTEGEGNQRDKHYYSQKCIDSPVTQKALGGKPCYINHPDAIEEQTLPERSVRDIGGYWDQLEAEGNALTGILTQTLTEAGKFVEQFLGDCLYYAKAHPGENLGGFSINGGGKTIPIERNGEEWHQVDEISEGFSVDLVTLPARGGQVLMALQSKRLAENMAAAGPLKIAKAMRAKITATDDKDLRRMVDNLISSLSGHTPTLEGDRMAIKLTAKALKEAKKKIKQAMQDGDAAKSVKLLHAYHKGKHAAAEQEGNQEDMAMHQAEMEHYAGLMGKGDEGEEEGDLVITHKGTTDGGDDAGADDDGDDDSAEPGVDEDEEPPMDQESEDETEDETESEDEVAAEAAAAEARKKATEAKRKKESAAVVSRLTREADRLENVSLRLQLNNKTIETKLTESGLPEFLFPRLKAALAGKTPKQMDAIIEGEQETHEHYTRESGAGVTQRAAGAGAGAGSGSKSFREADSILKKFKI